ncbi:MAG TPA: hypothetical protein VMP01_17940 [Pirellulaceae bacterium]|nr:hypothetical protein [Pirellulaceae bacterium]
MPSLWLILVEFLFRLTFGVAVSMALTPSKLVTSGFYRIHLWVLMGLMTFASLAIWGTRPIEMAKPLYGIWGAPLILAATAAVVSYLGAVIWMYEQHRAGKVAIWIVAGLAIVGCQFHSVSTSQISLPWLIVDRVTGGLVLGSITTAMLLGHWYLNTPTMKLDPLRRLIWLIVFALVCRMIVSGSGAWLEGARLAAADSLTQQWLLFLSLRWLAGLISPLGLAWMTWQTLKIPNTQSATGILYAAVILAFIGELTAQLMTASAAYPV